MNIKRCIFKVRTNNSTIQEIHNLISIKRTIKEFRNMKIDNFLELYSGIKLKWYQKLFLRLIEKDRNLQLIMSRQYRR